MESSHEDPEICRVCKRIDQTNKNTINRISDVILITTYVEKCKKIYQTKKSTFKRVAGVYQIKQYFHPTNN